MSHADALGRRWSLFEIVCPDGVVRHQPMSFTGAESAAEEAATTTEQCPPGCGSCAYANGTEEGPPPNGCPGGVHTSRTAVRGADL